MGVTARAAVHLSPYRGKTWEYVGVTLQSRRWPPHIPFCGGNDAWFRWKSVTTAATASFAAGRGKAAITRPGSYLSVGNGQRGYNFFGQEGTSPKSVGFGGLVPAPCQSCFFPRIDLTALLLGLKMASAVGAHFTGQGPSGHCSVVKRAELPAGNSSRVHPRHLPGRAPPSVWFTLDEH